MILLLKSIHRPAGQAIGMARDDWTTVSGVSNLSGMTGFLNTLNNFTP